LAAVPVEVRILCPPLRWHRSSVSEPQQKTHNEAGEEAAAINKTGGIAQLGHLADLDEP
jgi:hypothetical protein